MGFIEELWESVFVPGTTPALITATHASFIALIISLSVLIFVTRSIHFINLLVLAVLLYGSVIWFIAELNRVKEEEARKVAAGEVEAKETNETKDGELTEELQDGGVGTGVSNVTNRPNQSPKKRKV